MTEWIESAWRGWQRYITDGKLAAVFFAALLFLWFCRKGGARKGLLLYATATAACCVLPLTAAALMAYQTKFYDYQWIWSIVPLTAVSAWGIVLFFHGVWPGFGSAKRRQGLMAVALTAGVVLLSGTLGRGAGNPEEQGTERRQAREVLEQVKQAMAGEEICLWAPREILEYAREADGAIRLPYGRNMWNDALKGYAYDVYSEERKAMYQWMESVGGGGTGPDGGIALGDGVTKGQETFPEDKDGYESGEAHVKCALDAGVNCIAIPDAAGPEILGLLEEMLGIEAQKLEGYWIFYGWTD